MFYPLINTAVRRLRRRPASPLRDRPLNMSCVTPEGEGGWKNGGWKNFCSLVYFERDIRCNSSVTPEEGVWWYQYLACHAWHILRALRYS